ncbi:hypothetical protein [Halomonas sp. IOP_31]|uniref:hypothetical protein n=1 Tax=Halomonas sp. IOP_31 TaxID=2876584 RepID=UPI001E3E4116|nr:hypothetical protein [Halomonas sp. IOP_31]MCD6006923.1 hypothetical protein [Halomonas sp. IOP_31]
MKHIATMALAGILTGCAGMPGSHEPPHYDYNQQAIIAPGYPVERVDQPAGYTYAAIESTSASKEYSKAWDSGSGRMSDYGVGWNSDEGGTSVVVALFRSVDPQSYMFPLEDTDGFEFIDGNRVQYAFQEGRYRDVVGNAPDLIPGNAPGCAHGVYLVATSSDARRRFIGTLSDGLPCDELGQVTSLDREQQLDRAFRLMGLR